MLGLGLCLWFTFGLVSLAKDGFRGYRKPFVLFGRRRSSSPVSSSEKLKVIGETRSYNPTLLQPELRGRTGEGPQQRGWGDESAHTLQQSLLCPSTWLSSPPHFTGHSVSLQHWLHGSAIFIQHGASEVRKGSLETEAGRRPVKDLAWSHKGPSRTLVRGAQRSLENTREENSQPQ